LEREKTADVTSKNAQLKQSLKTAEERTEKLEAEIVQMKKSNLPSTVLILQQELEGFRKMNEASQERIVSLEDEKNRSAIASNLLSSLWDPDG